MKAANVTVIIPCYRCTDTIERAISSVFLQTLLPGEIILVEDGSDDGDKTANHIDALVKRFERKNKALSIQVIRHAKNLGAAAVRNTAWSAASFDYLAFLDADDVWHHQKIKVQYKWMESHPDVAFSAHEYQQIDVIRPESSIQNNIGVVPYSFNTLLWMSRFILPSVMLRKDIPYRFSIDMRQCEDRMLWLDIASSGVKLYKLNATMVFIFKPVFGARHDLSHGMRSMEKHTRIILNKLYDKGKINFLLYLVLSIFSFLKYIRRIVIVMVSRLREIDSFGRQQ